MWEMTQERGCSLASYINDNPSHPRETVVGFGERGWNSFFRGK